MAPGRGRSPAGGGARGGGGCGRGGVLGGRRESFMQSRRCCHCHSHSPRAARSRRERRERASERSEPGPAEGAPGRCLHRRLRRVPGPGEERRLVGRVGSRAGETQLQEGARPAQPPPAPEPGSPRRSPRGPEGTARRSPQPQGWSRSRRQARRLLPAGARRLLRIAQGCAPRRPGAARRGGPGRRS